MKKPFKSLALLGLVSFLATSCDDNAVYDNQEDCDVTYKVNFVYDMNLKWADAFPSEVHSVNLYVFDSNDNFVKEYTANGSLVDQKDFAITVDLQPGDYTFLAWCGLDNEGAANDSFTVSAPVAGQTKLQDMTCRLNVKTDSQYPAYSDSQIQFMYYGMLKASLPDSRDGKEYIYTVPLVKDTNHIRVYLQQLSGDPMSPEDFGFTIEAPNGVMAYDNLLLGNQTVNYLCWDKFGVEAGLFENESDSQNDLLTYADGVGADLSTCRMMADQSNVMKLTITNLTNGEVIASVPVIQYALMAKKYYEKAYGHSMTEQEFLDREDEYSMTFFLDKNDKWIDSYIYINSWRVVLHNYSVE